MTVYQKPNFIASWTHQISKNNFLFFFPNIVLYFARTFVYFETKYDLLEIKYFHYHDFSKSVFFPQIVSQEKRLKTFSNLEEHILSSLLQASSLCTIIKIK